MKKLAALLVLALFASTACAQTSTVRRLGVEDVRYKIGTYERPSRLSTDGTIDVSGMTPINVLAFGVDNTGATDCADSLQAAVDSVYAWGGGNIYMPPGDYLVAEPTDASYVERRGITLKDGVHLWGERGTNIILATQIAGTDSFPASSAIYADGAYNIGVHGVDISFESGQPTGATHQVTGICFESCGSVTIEDVNVSGAPYAGIYIFGSHEEYVDSGVIIERCRVSDTEAGFGRGIYLSQVYCGSQVYGNELVNIGHSAIAASFSTGVMIGQNRIYGPSRDGIEIIGGAKVSIVSNHVDGFKRYGVSLSQSSGVGPVGVAVSSNSLTGNNSTGDCGIFVMSADGVSITGNNIRNVNWDGQLTGAAIGGIVCQQSGTVALQDIDITGNVIQNIDPDYAGGLVGRPFAIRVKGDGGPVRGITINGNTIENSYGAIYMRATGARDVTLGSIRTVTVGVDTTTVADTTAPTASDSVMVAFEDGDSGNVVINWSLTASEQGTATARWRINSDSTWNVDTPTALSLYHSDAIYTSEDAVQDDSVFVDVLLEDQVGNQSTWIDLGFAVIDTIAVDPSDTTAPTVTPGGVNYVVSGGVITLPSLAYTNENDGAIHQYRYRVNGGTWVNQSWSTTYSNLHSEVITTSRAPTDGDEFDVYMRAEDNSLNMSAWAPIDSVTVSVTDGTPPVISGGNVSAYESGGNVNIYYSYVTDEGAVPTQTRYTRNGSPSSAVGPSDPGLYVTSHSSTWYTGITAVDGDVYTIEAIVEDEAGNASSDWVEIGTSVISLSAAGDPAIDYVSSSNGTYSNGVVLTIAGENFGDDAGSDTPLIWDDFEGGTPGQAIEAASDWTLRTTGSYVDPVYSTENSRSTWRPQVCKFWNYGLQEYLIIGDLPTSATGKLFFSMWARPNVPFFGQDWQIKGFRLTSQPGTNDANDYSTYGPYLVWESWREGGNGTYYDFRSDAGSVGGHALQDYESAWPSGQWMHVQVAVDMGSFGGTDAYYDIWENGTQVEDGTEPFALLESDHTSYIRQVRLGHTFTNLEGADEAATSTPWHYDDVYFSNTWRRVELGDNATYENCTVREMQPTLSWSQNNVQIDFNPGSFSAGQTAYLFVVDNEGTASAGESITIGGSSQDVPPAATIDFYLEDGTGYEQILVADTRPGGASIDSDITCEWRYSDSATWSTIQEYSGVYVAEPYVYEYTGVYADATPDTLRARVKLKSAAGVESDWIYNNPTTQPLVAYNAPDSSVPTIVEENLVPYSLEGEAAIQGQIIPSVAASACVQYKVNSGSWAPADTTLATGVWTPIGDAQDPISVNKNSGYTTTPGDTVYFRVTLRNADGTEHTGSWYTLDSYIEPGATSKRWLWTFAQANNYAESSLDTTDFDVVVYNQSVEGVVDVARPTTYHSQPSGSNTWENDMDYGGSLPWASDGSMYIWYPGAVGDSISGLTVTEATLYIQPYNNSNDLTGSGEGLICVAVYEGGTYADWDFPNRTSWDFSWAYSEVSTTTTWITAGAQAWSTVPSFSAMGDTLLVPVNFVSATPASIDVTELVQAIADEHGGGGNDIIGLLFTIKSLDGGGTRLTFLTGDGGSTDNHPVLTITTEE